MNISKKRLAHLLISLEKEYYPLKVFAMCHLKNKCNKFNSALEQKTKRNYTYVPSTWGPEDLGPLWKRAVGSQT